MADIDVYRVGLWSDVHRHGLREGVRRSLWYVRRQAQNRNWRAIKNTLNGFLAEPAHDVPGLVRCGSGWTRRRALRSLQRHLTAAAASGTREDGEQE